MGITYPQYLVLLVLWEAGPLPVQHIADKLEIEGATATPLIKRMEAIGLVTRTRSAEDERRVLVGLTDKGETYRHKSVDIPERLGCIVNLSDSQAGKLLQELNAIRHGLDVEAS
ncbi:MAG: MarR family transcriptional regulator [Pseudomonadota bacterium]